MAYLIGDKDSAVVILGTGGFAVELGGLLLAEGRRLIGFVGDSPKRSLPAEWLGTDDIIGALPNSLSVLVAIGNPQIRRQVSQKLNQHDIQLGIFKHSKAYVSNDVQLKAGCVIYPHATVHTGVSLQKGVLINSNATVGHETHIGAYTSIGPGVSIGGRCIFGEEIYVGIGASSIERIKIVAKTVLGAGAVVVSNIEEPGTYIGIPARRRIF